MIFKFIHASRQIQEFFFSILNYVPDVFILQKVDVLCGIGIKKVACGTQFSVALTKDGHVYTFGQGKAFSWHYIVCFGYTCVIETFAFQFFKKCSKLSHFLFWVMNVQYNLHSLAPFLLLFMLFVIRTTLHPIDGSSCQSLHSC